MYRVLLVIAVALVQWSLAPAAAAAPQGGPVVAGLGHDGLDPRLRGLVWLGELGCTACHDAGARAASIDATVAPRLAAVGARVLPGYLRSFIADPHGTKPGSTMPDVMAGMEQPERSRAALALTHYLVSLSPTRSAPVAPDRVAAARGRELFHSIGCVACHAPRRDGVEISTPGSVPLGRLQDKYGLLGLSRFLAAPHHVRPGGRMPDFDLAPGESHDLAHYLLRDVEVPGRVGYTLYLGAVADGIDRLAGKEHASGQVDDFGLAPWRDYREAFAVEFETLLSVPRSGRYTFRLAVAGLARLRIGDRQVAEIAGDGDPAVASVDLDGGLHRLALTYLHRGGERRLDLQFEGPGVNRQPVGAAKLQVRRQTVTPFAPLVLDPAEVRRGRQLFGQLGCARCHATDGAPQSPPAAALGELDPARGCLSGQPGRWPAYGLDRSQGADLRAALGAAEFVPTDAQRIRQALATFNCVACHQRGETGGVSAARSAFFTTHDPNLGEAGRLPPPLTGVGAKLQAKWLRDALVHGQAIRPYMKTRMPGFGPHAAALAALFKRVDRLPAAPFRPLPKARKKAREITDIGHRLAGTQGLACITCHTFGGQRAAAMAAVDLVDSTGERLEPTWFYHYMLDPVKFRRSTLMPQFFPGGVSVRDDIAGGDSKRQLEGLWYYLAAGRNTRRPRGLVRPAMNLAVGDEAVMLRRKVQNTGKRGISVGYPLGVNLTFDAESLGLNQIWWGEFIDTAGVWTGQGSGAARILSRQRVSLPKGPAFVELPAATAPWPAVSRRQLGHRFLGYDLGPQRRPVFRYLCHDVTILDAPREQPAAGPRPILRRELKFECAADKTLYFRAAVDKQLEDLGGGRVRVGRSLLIRVQPPTTRVRAAGEVKELIVPVPIRGGAARLVLEYTYLEAGK